MILIQVGLNKIKRGIRWRIGTRENVIFGRIDGYQTILSLIRLIT